MNLDRNPPIDVSATVSKRVLHRERRCVLSSFLQGPAHNTSRSVLVNTPSGPDGTDSLKGLLKSSRELCKIRACSSIFLTIP
jgi:hypothetical protein